MAPKKQQTPPNPQPEEVEKTAVSPATKVKIKYNSTARVLLRTTEELTQQNVATLSESAARARLRRITDETAKFSAALDEYKGFFPDEEPDEELGDTARDLMSQLDEQIESFSATRPVSTIQPLQEKTASTTCKLPKLELLTFTGKLEEWALFWGNFESSVHCQEDLSDDVKLRYLTSALRDEAKNVLGEVLTANEYAEAVNRLQRRFGDRQQHIFHYLQLILETPELKSKGVSNQSAHDGVQRALSVLRCFGLQGEALLEALLSHLIVQRF